MLLLILALVFVGFNKFKMTSYDPSLQRLPRPALPRPFSNVVLRLPCAVTGVSEFRYYYNSTRRIKETTYFRLKQEWVGVSAYLNH